MFVKKLVSYLILPFPVILLLLVAGVLLLLFTSKQRTGKVLITVGVALMLILSSPLTTTAIVAPLRQSGPFMDPRPAAAARWIVVLGGGFLPQSSGPATSRLSGASLERLVEAIRIHRLLTGAKLVLSGGRQSEQISVAELMAEAAESLGVPRSELVLEPRTADTQDEARLVQDIVRQDPFVLVTSAGHMRRAQSLFQARGMKPIPAPAGAWSDAIGLLPSSGGLAAVEQAEHEYVGMLWARLRGAM